jgi:hypothetical protein
MMATYSKELLSGSTGGRPIKVAATATPGTTIHATGIASDVVDEVWLYAHNTDSADVVLTLEFGDVTSPDDLLTVTVPAEDGLLLLVPGLPLTGDGSSAREIKAFAAVADDVTISGYVNRITP